MSSHDETRPLGPDARPPGKAASLELGDVLAGRYEIRSLLGRGGMGAVYEAWDRDLELSIALKTLGRKPSAEDGNLRRLKREVLLARQVSHPNVCRLHDLWRDEGRGLLFATMELIRGETLEERLTRQGRLEPGECLPLVEQMVRGLEAAHEAGVVHRDFKAANVMLEKEAAGDRPRAVLTDFGIAGEVHRDVSNITEQLHPAGTPAYMAPEQLRGERASPASDIYALGAVLFEMVTGRLPFESSDGRIDVSRKLAEDAPTPRLHQEELPEAWERVILKCLSRDPEDRFERAGAVLESLEEKQESRPEPCDLVGNLPPARNGFFGRERELEEISRLLKSDGRLVSVLGTAGSGKTRLAREFGRAMRRHWPGGVWFCDLTDAHSANGISSAVARALDVATLREHPVKQLGHAIAAHGRCLLILDNFEQVVSLARETVGHWMEQAPEAAFLVTSRERLPIADDGELMLETLDDETACSLFVERAQRIRPGFSGEDDARAAILELVRLLEGLPLAIELAAARVPMMSPAQIAARMTDRFRLLRGAKTERRHAALRAAIDTSWDLLEPWEKAAFAQCSVFEGGFTLEAAEEVVDLAEYPEAPWVVDVLQALLEKSLLRLVPIPSNESRFSMYVSLQEYAAQRLAEDERRAAEERHGRHFAGFGTLEAVSSLGRHGGVELHRKLSLDLDNFVSACRRGIARGDGEAAVRNYRAAWAVLELRGPAQAGVELAREVLGLHGLSSALRMEGLWAAGGAHWAVGEMDAAKRYFEDALDAARESGDRCSEGVLIGNLGILDRMQGRMEEAEDRFEQALAIHREVGNRKSVGAVLGNLAILHMNRGENDQAQRCYEEALAVQRETGNRHLEGVTLGNLANLHAAEDRLKEALDCYEQALAVYRETGDRRYEGILLGNLGNRYAEQGRLDEARQHFEQALSINREIGNRNSEGLVLGNLGELACRRERFREAREYFDAAEELLRTVGTKIELGELLCKRGEYALATANTDAASAALREARDLARTTDAGPDSSLGRRIRGLAARLDEPQNGKESMD